MCFSVASKLYTNLFFNHVQSRTSCSFSFVKAKISDLNAFLILETLGRRIEHSSIAFVERKFEEITSRLEMFNSLEGETDRIEGDPTSFEGLKLIPQWDVGELDLKNLIAKTVGLSSLIGCYGLATSVITAVPMPLESIPSCLLFVPWWASSKWVEWPCLNFLLASQSMKENQKDFLSQWTRYESNEEARWGFLFCKPGFYVCSAAIFGLYAYVAYKRPPLTRELLERSGVVSKDFEKENLKFFFNHFQAPHPDDSIVF